MRYFICLQVSGTIRNCCFEAESQLQNLLLISEFLWPALLLPVAGNKVVFCTFLTSDAFIYIYIYTPTHTLVHFFFVPSYLSGKFCPDLQ